MIKFQEEDFDPTLEHKLFIKKNYDSGSIMSFLGKVRSYRKKEKILSMKIEFYEKMALFQTKTIIENIKKKIEINDYLIIHRYGKLLPGENIVFILVATYHRKEGFYFLESIIDHLKKKITFWKKENFKNKSRWVDPISID